MILVLNELNLYFYTLLKDNDFPKYKAGKTKSDIQRHTPFQRDFKCLFRLPVEA